MKTAKLAWNSIVFTFTYVVMALYVLMLNREKVSAFKNVHFSDGVRIDNKILYLTFGGQGIPLSLISDQGRIALIHGDVDGSFFSHGKRILQFQLPLVFNESGEYILLSCYNGNRKDVITPCHKFIRDRKTSTPYPIFMVSGSNGTLLIYSGVEVEVYTKFLQKITFSM